MSRRWNVLVVASFLALTGCGVQEKIEKAVAGDKAEKAKLRVTTILEGVKRDGGGTGTDIQTSMCQWRKGVPLISDPAELAKTSDDFSQWCRDKGIDRKIESYEVVSAEPVAGKDGTYLVKVKIEGSPRKMLVPDGQQIRWVD